MQTRNASQLREPQRTGWLWDTGYHVICSRPRAGRELLRSSRTMNEGEIDPATSALTPARFSFVARAATAARLAH